MAGKRVDMFGHDKKGYHTWPDNDKPHPVGKRHKKKSGKGYLRRTKKW